MTQVESDQKLAQCVNKLCERPIRVELLLMQQGNSPSARLDRGMRQLAQREYQALHLDSIEMIKQNVRDPIPYFLLGNLA
ncbi:MAG: hypothetical protein AAFR82_08675, partial [Pseudomonadota bacterium]